MNIERCDCSLDSEGLSRPVQKYGFDGYFAEIWWFEDGKSYFERNAALLLNPHWQVKFFHPETKNCLIVDCQIYLFNGFWALIGQDHGNIGFFPLVEFISMFYTGFELSTFLYDIEFEVQTFHWRFWLFRLLESVYASHLEEGPADMWKLENTLLQRYYLE